jgi:hypothetical protein
VVRHGLDRTAHGCGARGRRDRGPVRSLRRSLPLPRRGHRPAEAPRPDHRRPGQGLGDHRPRWLSPVLRGFARQLPPDRGPRPAGPDRAVVARCGHERARAPVERRLGRRPARPGRLPAGGRGELVVLRDPVEPRLRRRWAGHGRSAGRRDDAGLRRPPAGVPRRSGPSDLDRGVGLLLRRGGLRGQLGRPGAGLRRLRRAPGGRPDPAGVPVLDGRRHRRDRGDRR